MRFFAFVLVVIASPAIALTPEAKEFLAITKKLEPVVCQKRQLRREFVLAEVENRRTEAAALKNKVAALDRDPETVKLQKRLAELEPRILDSKGTPRFAEDLDAISLQRRQAFYRCE